MSKASSCTYQDVTFLHQAHSLHWCAKSVLTCLFFWVRSVCNLYVISSYILVILTLGLPVAIISYLMHRGVHHHTVWVPAEGNFFTRFYQLLMESRHTWFDYCGYGFKTAVETAWADAGVRGEWKVRVYLAFTAHAWGTCDLAQMCVCVYIRMHTCAHACLYTHVQSHAGCIHTYLHMHMHMHMHLHVYVYT